MWVSNNSMFSPLPVSMSLPVHVCLCDMASGEDSGRWYRKCGGYVQCLPLHTLKGWATQKLKCALFIEKPSHWLDPSSRWMGPHSSRPTHSYTEDVHNIMLTCVWQNLTKMIEQRPQRMIPRVEELLLWSISQKKQLPDSSMRYNDFSSWIHHNNYINNES